MKGGRCLVAAWRVAVIMVMALEVAALETAAVAREQFPLSE